MAAFPGKSRFPDLQQLIETNLVALSTFVASRVESRHQVRTAAQRRRPFHAGGRRRSIQARGDSESREMLDLLVFVVAGADAVFHDPETDVIAAAPFDQMIA